MSKVTDTHTLYVSCRDLTEDQVHKNFSKLLGLCVPFVGHTNCRFLVNFLRKRDGTGVGAAYVFLTHPEVYHVLTGKNPDGSARVETKKVLVMKEINWDEPASSWADLCEQELDEYRIEEKPLSPLLEIPEEMNMKVSPYEARLPDDCFFNVLKSNIAPDWITPQMIKSSFTPFASDSRTLHERKINKKIIKESYPFVNKNKRGEFFVTFDPHGYDGIFACQMMRFFPVKRTLPETKEIETCNIIFNHASSREDKPGRPRDEKPRNRRH